MGFYSGSTRDVIICEGSGIVVKIPKSDRSVQLLGIEENKNETTGSNCLSHDIIVPICKSINRVILDYIEEGTIFAEYATPLGITATNWRTYWPKNIEARSIFFLFPHMFDNPDNFGIHNGNLKIVDYGGLMILGITTK